MKPKIDKRQTALILYAAIGSAAAVFNTLFFTNQAVSYIVIAVEIAAMLYLVFYKRFTEFMVLYILFITSCVEFSAYVGTSAFYNLKNVRLLGVNLGIWVMLIPILIALIHIRSIWKLKQSYPVYFKFSAMLIAINIIAMLVGVLLILANDNQIQSMEGYLHRFAGETYLMFFLPLAFFSCFSLILLHDRQNLWRVGIGLQAVLISLVVQSCVSLAAGTTAAYGEDATLLLTSVVYYFIPLMLLFVLYRKDTVFGTAMVILAVIGTFLSLRYSANGKIIITTALVLVIIFITLLRSKNKAKRITALALLVLACILTPLLLNYIADKSPLTEGKLYQVKSLFAFGPNWLKNMSMSPKVRVNELMNIGIEYSKKPWLILTGKGILGSVKDYTGLWGELEEAARLSAFTAAEWDSGVFYTMHEITSLLLLYGLAGIVFIFQYLKLCFKHYRECIWFIFGAYWLLLFYGFSLTLGAFGIAAIFLSLLSVQDSKETILSLQRVRQAVAALRMQLKNKNAKND